MSLVGAASKKLLQDSASESGPLDYESARKRCLEEKALFEEYAAFGRDHWHDLGPFDLYYRDDVRGLKWPVIDGKETHWRFNKKHDSYVEEGNFQFYGPAREGRSISAELIELVRLRIARHNDCFT